MAIPKLVIQLPDFDDTEDYTGPELLNVIPELVLPDYPTGMTGIPWLAGVTWQPRQCTAITTGPAAMDSTALDFFVATSPAQPITQLPFCIQDAIDVNAIEWDARFGTLDDQLQERYEDQISWCFARELLTAAASGSTRGLKQVAHAPTDRPFNSAATPALNAVAILENELSRTLFNAPGILHLTPGIFSLISWKLTQRADGSWWTPRGNQVCSDSGYVDAPAPTGAAASGVNDDWIYASGGVWYKKTDPMFMGDNEFDFTNISTNKIERIQQSFGILVFDPCPVTACLASYNETVYA